MADLQFGLRPAAPFRLDLTAWALRRRARNIVDRWDGSTYRRVLVIDETPAEVAVTQVGSCENPRLAVKVAGRITSSTKPTVIRLLTRMLGLKTKLQPFYTLAAADRRLAPLVEKFRGLKPPQYPTIFEGLVNGVACQQLSLTVGIELLNRLATQCGPPLLFDHAEYYAFPRAKDILKREESTFRHLGFSQSKTCSLLRLSEEIVAGQFSPDRVRLLDNESAVEMLMRLRGIGRWTAEYVLLRGLGRIDTFPGDDVGARKRLASWLGHQSPLEYEDVKRAVQPWYPYAGLVYFHLLLEGLNKSGEITAAKTTQSGR